MLHLQLQISAYFEEQNSLTLLLDNQMKNFRFYRIKDFAPTSHLTSSLQKFLPARLISHAFPTPITSRSSVLQLHITNEEPQGSGNLSPELHYPSVEYEDAFRSSHYHVHQGPL
jgi:hypothetical protein